MNYLVIVSNSCSSQNGQWMDVTSIYMQNYFDEERSVTSFSMQVFIALLIELVQQLEVYVAQSTS